MSPSNIPLSRRGIGLIEMAVCIALIGPIFLGMALLVQVGVKYFARAQAGQLYHLHVEPLELLALKQLRHCRYAVYATLADARSANSAAKVPAGSFLRADRMDGNGWFILEWNEPDHSLNLVTDSGSDLVFTRTLRRWASGQDFFDTTQGFLLMRCALVVPAALQFLHGSNTEIHYVISTERQT